MTRHLTAGLGAAMLVLAACGSHAPSTAIAPPNAAPASAAPAMDRPTTAIVGATLLTMKTRDAVGARLEDHTVLVAGARIVAVGPTSRVHVPAGATAIDARGKVLLPGLVDAHVHLAHAAHLPLYVARGVTTVRNMWGAPMHLAWRREIEEGRRLGPTIRTAGPIVDGDDPVHDGSFVARSPADADRAVALHVEQGYDFVKAYTKLDAATFERLVARARDAGLAVVGHVPREVGLLRALDAGLHTVEHTNTFYDALQADDSPVKGKADRASRRVWVDHLDTAKLGAVADHFSAGGAWACPTRVVMHGWEPPAAQRARLARPEVRRFTSPSELAVWAPGGDADEAQQRRDAREIEVADAIVRALHARGVGVLAGTDVGNPLVVPGYALHEEIAELSRIGLGPYAALRAATHDAAIALGMERDIGTIAAGKRADLLLVDGDPLRDVHATASIRGVMVRGRWIDAADSEQLLDEVERWAHGDDDPFAERAPLGAAGGVTRLSARFRVSWKDVPFDTERVTIQDAADGGTTVSAEVFDPHLGAWSALAMHVARGGSVDALTLAGDGATGRGRIDVTRPEAGRLHAEGTARSGDRIAEDVAIDPEATIVVDRFLAGLVALPVRDARDVKIVSLSLGSALVTKRETWKITPRGALVEIDAGKGPPRVLELDGRGEPRGLTSAAFGASLVWKKLP